MSFQNSQIPVGQQTLPQKLTKYAVVVKNTDQQLPLRKVIKVMNHNYDFETVIKFECQKMSFFTAHKLVQTF